MSSRRQLEKALRRAAARDRKRRPRMPVSGKGIFTLHQVINKSSKQRSSKG